MTNDFKDHPDGIIYFIYIISKNAVKIGVSRVDTIKTRLSEHRRSYGDIVELGYRFGSYDMETEIHTQFDKYRFHRRGRKGGTAPEWFHYNGEIHEYILQQTASPQTMRPLIEVMRQRGNGVDKILTKLWLRRFPFVPRNQQEIDALVESSRLKLTAWMQAMGLE